MSACWWAGSFRKRMCAKLIELGVARVFGPGTVIDEIAEFHPRARNAEAAKRNSRSFPPARSAGAEPIC